MQCVILSYALRSEGSFIILKEPSGLLGDTTFLEHILLQTILQNPIYSTNHVYLHRLNAFGFWQMRLHLCYETLKRISNFSELA